MDFDTHNICVYNLEYTYYILWKTYGFFSSYFIGSVCCRCQNLRMLHQHLKGTVFGWKQTLLVKEQDRYGKNLRMFNVISLSACK